MHTTAATDPDVTATTAIQTKLAARGLPPGEHLMDAGYPSAENITNAAEAGITLITPVTARNGRNAKTDLFTPYDFEVDWEAGCARCPAGATSRSMRPDKRGLVTFAFSRRDCVPCDQREKCTRAALPMVRRLTVPEQPVHQAVLAARAGQDGEEWKTLYHKRAGVEGTISQAVRGPDLRHARYRGLAKTHVQNVCTAIAITICRLGAHYDKPTPPRRPTRVSHLCDKLGLNPT